MRELDRTNHTTNASAPTPENPTHGESSPRPRRLTVIGNGRAGKVLAAAFRSAGIAVEGPLARGVLPSAESDVVLICTPDSTIEDVALLVPQGPAVGHCCGAHGTEILGPSHQTFCLHPLMTITESSTASDLVGAWSAIDGSDEDMLALAGNLASKCGMTPIQIESSDRAAYHAAASVASNFLITLEAAAEEIAATAGLPREALLPLIEATLDNWASLGPSDALTGPVARGDVATVERQRHSVEQRRPELLPLFDALCGATEQLARSKAVA